MKRCGRLSDLRNLLCELKFGSAFDTTHARRRRKQRGYYRELRNAADICIQVTTTSEGSIMGYASLCSMKVS